MPRALSTASGSSLYGWLQFSTNTRFLTQLQKGLWKEIWAEVSRRGRGPTFSLPGPELSLSVLASK